MNEELVERLDLARAIAALGIDAKRQGDQLVARCPRTRTHPAGDMHPSWAIRVRGEPLGVHGCWSCGYAGSITSLVREMLGFKPDADGWAQVEAWLLEHADKGVVPEAERVTVKIASSLLVPRQMEVPAGVHVDPPMEWPMPPRRYLQERGVSAGDVVLWGLGWASSGRCAGRIWIPVYQRTGFDSFRLCGYTSRSFDGRKPKYLDARKEEGTDSSVLFAEHTWADQQFRDTVRVCEGEFNAMAARRYLIGDVCAIGGVENLNDAHLLKLSTFPRVVVMADPDAAGRRLEQKLREQLGGRVVCVDLPAGFDVAKLAHEDRKELLRRAELCDRDGRARPRH